MTTPVSSAQSLRDAAVGALVGAFVGDALGMPYEGQPGDAVPDVAEMRGGRAPAGSYTDDTQMMIALAESLVRCDGIVEEDLAAAFRAQYEPERGYGSGTRSVMALWDEGVPIREAAGAHLRWRGFRGQRRGDARRPRRGALLRRRVALGARGAA
jgi:ADP-ribosylglycohydrolase